MDSKYINVDTIFESFDFDLIEIDNMGDQDGDNAWISNFVEGRYQESVLSENVPSEINVLSEVEPEKVITSLELDKKNP